MLFARREQVFSFPRHRALRLFLPVSENRAACAPLAQSSQSDKVRQGALNIQRKPLADSLP